VVTELLVKETKAETALRIPVVPKLVLVLEAAQLAQDRIKQTPITLAEEMVEAEFLQA
jgi:hypothetical protein